jgi:hypothetical protein
MADSSSQTATERAAPSDADLEKGVSEPASDLDAAGNVPRVQDVAPGDENDKLEKEETDPNVVSWDGPDDPTNPMNWTMRKKWANIAVLSVLTLIT